MNCWTLRSRWIIPIGGSPIRDGLVVIADDRIVSVESAGTRSVDVDLGDAAVLPGLVNAHTHLDLTGMRGLAPPTPDFTGWLRQVITYRRARSPKQVQNDIRAGLLESLRAGVTLLGDISGDGSSWDLLKEAPLRAIVFRELLGLSQLRADEAFKAASDWLDTRTPTQTCRPALSPHAPYSASRKLVSLANFLAWNRQVPLGIHLAESAAEVELLRFQRGAFVPFLRELGVWDPSDLFTSLAAVLRVLAEPTCQLIVHGNHLPQAARIRRHQTVVYCPRTHARFGHPPHPFLGFLARGVRVALGTDSLASNPDLDMLAEARFLHKHRPDASPEVILLMATLSGAKALGWGDETGSLEAGKSADLAVFPLASTEGDPHRLVLESPHPVRAVLFRGKWVHDALGELSPAFS